MSEVTTVSLDEAWAEAEAALPEYWFIRSLLLSRPYSAEPTWEVVAADQRVIKKGQGLTPAAALNDLARQFR